MPRAVSVVVLAAFCWFVFGAHDASWALQAAAQTPADQREISDRLRLISPGTEITVYLTGQRVLEGTLRLVETDAIVVDHKKGGGSTRVPLAEIERLKTKSKGHKTVTYILVGTAVAVGAVLVLAVAACSSASYARQRG